MAGKSGRMAVLRTVVETIQVRTTAHYTLFLLTDLLAEVVLVTQFLHLVKLGFQLVDVFLFIFEKALE